MFDIILTFVCGLVGASLFWGGILGTLYILTWPGTWPGKVHRSV